MKIAVAYQYVYPQHFGGGEKRLFEIFSKFPQEITVDYYPQYAENYSDYPQLSRFNIKPLQSVMDPGGERSFKETILFTILLFLKLDIKKYDYVHVGQMPFFHILPLQFKKLLYSFIGVKTANITVDWWEYWGKYWNKYNKFVCVFGQLSEKVILKLVKNIVVISNKTQRDIGEITNGKITLIHNGVDLDKISKSPIGEESDVVILGRLVEWKNVLMGIKVFQKMLLKSPELKMGIIGSGPQKQYIEDYISQNDLKKNIKLHGFVREDEDIYSILKGSKLMMLFSKQEGGGSITLFEGNACGLPVATCYFENGIDEDLVTEENGFFYKDSCVDTIAEDLSKYIASKDEIKNYNTSSIKYAQQYDWKRISQQYIEFFKNNLK